MARFQKNPVSFTLVVNEDELNLIGTVLSNVENINTYLPTEFTDSIYQNMTHTRYNTDGTIELIKE